MSSAAAGAGECGAVHTVQEGVNGKGEDGAELKAVAASVKAGSGKAGAERGGDGDLGGQSWGRQGQRRLQSGRALGAQPARRSRGRWRGRTRRRGSGTAVDAATTTAQARRRRPWCGEGEGEELGRVESVSELGEEVGDRTQPPERRGEEAGQRAAAWRALRPPSSTCLPSWPSQAARWSGSWAGPVGR